MISRRAISPVIATVIIVAVAIAISIAVAGWLFGLWGGFAGGQPEIQVSAAKVQVGEFAGNTTTPDIKVFLYIVNSGSASDNILRIDLIYDNTTQSYNENSTNVTVTVNGTNDTDGPPVTISANFSGWVELIIAQDVNNPPNIGDSVTVKIYFEKVGPISIPAVVSSG